MPGHVDKYKPAEAASGGTLSLRVETDELSWVSDESHYIDYRELGGNRV